MVSAFRPQLVGALASAQRAFGLHPRSRPLENLSERSRRALSGLNASPKSLRFQIALRQLGHDWDLFTEEATSDAAALRLQLRVLDLAERSPEAERLIRPNLSEAPISRLLATTLVNATAQGASAVEFRFGSPQEETSLIYQIRGQEREAGQLPRDLEESLRGLLRFVEAAGFGRIKPYLGPSPKLPNDLAFAWPERDRLTITLG